MESYLSGGQLQFFDDYGNLADFLLKSENVDGSYLKFENSNKETVYSYEDFIQLVYKMCNLLNSQNIYSHDYAILLLKSKELFSIAFWACILSNIIPVILDIPDEWEQDNSKLGKLKVIQKTLPQAHIICESEITNILKSIFKTVNYVNASQYKMFRPNFQGHSSAGKSDIAMLAVTSGSSGIPKIVQLSHQNLIAATLGNIQKNLFTSKDIFINWMPMDHVYTIMLLNLVPMLLKSPQIHIQDIRVFVKPSLCFYYLQKYKASVTWMLNFMFELFINEELTLHNVTDLTRVRYIMNGGEKINQNVLLNTIDRLKSSGLNPNAICPAWGMTETSSGVIYNSHASSATTDSNLFGVCLGFPIPGITIRIVDEKHTVLVQGQPGYLEISGFSVTKNYLNNATANEEAFNGSWFATGDIGVITDSGMYFIGRDKNDININGRNIDLAEIEEKINAVPGVVSPYSIALSLISLNNTKEELVICVVLEEQKTLANSLVLLQQLLIENFGIVANTIYQISVDNIPRNSIGKILKKEVKKQIEEATIKYLDITKSQNNLNQEINFQNKIIFEQEQASITLEIESLGFNPDKFFEVLSKVSDAWSKILEITQIGVDQSFFSLGGSSLKAIHLQFKIHDVLGISLTLMQVFKYNTIKQMTSGICLIQNNLNGNSISTIPTLKSQINSIEQQVLSSGQKRLWFIDNYENGCNAYNLPLLIQVRVSNEIRELEQALIATVSRHEVLHSLIKVNKDGICYQEVFDLVTFPLIIRQVSVTDQDAMENIITNKVQSIFKLDQEYPIKITLILREDKNEYFILLVVHHIAFDGWSTDVFLRDLQELYSYYQQKALDVIEGTNIANLNLPELTLQYKDYALWENTFLSSEQIQQQLNYWENKLSNYESLNLPIDKHRPKYVEYKGDDVYFDIDEITSKKLHQLAQSLNVSLYSLLLSGFYLLLGSYSNQENLTIGIPSVTRSISQLENLVGFFANNLVLIVKLDKDASLINYIQQVSLNILEAQENQDIPFNMLLDKFHTTPDHSRSPIFQVVFDVGSFGRNRAYHDFKLLESAAYNLNYKVARFDLSVTLDVSQKQITGLFNYATSLFNVSTINKYIQTYKHILLQISFLTPNASTKIYDLDYLGYRDRLLIDSWNQTTRYYSKDKTIHELFEEQVRRTPDNIAVVYESTQFTYHELNQKANQLAHYLKNAYQIHGDDLVLLCLDRSEYLLIAILAVLKSGAAYVPIDPSYPRGRITYIFNDTKAKLLLTNHVHQEILCSIINKSNQVLPIELIDTHETQSCLKLEAMTNPIRNVQSTNLVYVIYTSGTSGKPKGVMVEHQNLVNLAQEFITTHCLSEYVEIAIYSNYVFDAFVYEVIPALLNGNKLYMLNNETRLSLDKLESFIIRNRIKVIFIPAVLLVAFLTRLKNTNHYLKFIYSGGEGLPQISNAILNDKFVLVNEYGPTEATVCATLHRFKFGDLNSNIGKPIGNTITYILSNTLNLAPIGAIGELYLGGACLGRGYLNHPELTAEKFIPNPFLSSEDKQLNRNTKLYKTGDLVRYLANGDLEYIGRSDSQIKIHGYRLELSEIEKVINSYPGIQQSCIVVKDKQSKDSQNKYLVGYYVLDNEYVTSNDEVILNSWENLYDNLYSEVIINPDVLNPDFSGWNSFITSKPIPVLEMKHWRDSTVKRIKTLQPNKLLEIGVGSGLLMYPLLEVVDQYIGLDISSAVIKQHQKYLNSYTDYKVDLYHLTADRIDEVCTGELFDCLILNSVCQYFPSIQYFENVVIKALNRLKLGGNLFIGDIRNYNLQDELIKEKLFYESGSYTEIAINEILKKESELLIAPEYFQELAGKMNNFSIQVLEKQGEYHNELSKYRFDVIITLIEPPLSIFSQNSLFEFHKKHMYNVPFLNKLTANQIIAKLNDELPEYMVPQILIEIEVLPLTTNGKLDYKALPDPEATNLDNYVAPRTTIEVKVCALYAEVLGLNIDKIGISADFFTLGGNSFIAIMLVNKLNQMLESNIKISDLFKFRTILQLSSLIEETIGQFKYKSYYINNYDLENLYEPFVLSNVQQAYYLGRNSEFELGNISTHAYIEQKYTFLDVLALEKAINCLIQRHLGLRTIFINGMQQYLQNYPYYHIKQSILLTEKSLLELRDSLSHKVYAADSFPLFGFIVSKCCFANCEEYYILHISFDGLLMDGNSMQIFFAELAKFYTNSELILPKLQINYRDYLLQLDKIRRSDLFNTAREYWQKKLGNYDFEVNLPLRCKATEVKTPHFCRISKIIIKSIWDKLLAKALAYNLSPTAVVMVVYGKVLNYWSNQEKICINLTLFNRLPLHEQIDDIIGDFTVLELYSYSNWSVHKSLKIIEELRYNHEMLWQDIEHNLFDGIDCQRLIREKYSSAQNQIIAPIVLTSILGKNSYGKTFIDDSYLGVNYSITQTSQVWIDNKAYEIEDGFVAEWDYVEQLFSQEVIEAMHEDYCKLIEHLAEANWEDDEFLELRIPAKDLAIINQANSAVQKLSEETLFSYYEAYITKNELYSNIAVIEGATGNRYSYTEVLRDSEFLAKYLNYITQESGGVIGVLSEKGYNQVISTLGIMKSGSSYLPLNIDWPVGRLDEVMAQGAVKVLLISNKQVDHTVSLKNKYQILIIEELLTDLHANKLPQKINQVVLPKISKQDIAYVIFTSGSTGVPKGVSIRHEGALNTVLAVNSKYQVTMKDKILALSELSFDLSVYDIFGLLAVGGTIVFPDSERIKELKHWLELINEYQVSIWNTVPQLAGLLIDEAKSGQLQSKLRLFLLSGDWIPLNLPLQIKVQLPDSQVVSLGGATEGSIWSIWYEIEEVDQLWKSIPYGMAMPNQKMYVLNSSLKDCPIGVVGDIYIGGVGVAINYCNDAIRTKDSFINHDKLGRIYKTGDLGSWNANGYMEFAGRVDNQVKLNGHRIELSEIESKLSNIPGIIGAFVTTQKNVQQNYLVAYIIPDNLVIADNNSVEVVRAKEEFKLAKHGIRTDLNDDLLLNITVSKSNYHLHKSYRQYLDENLNLDIVNETIGLVETRVKSMLFNSTDSTDVRRNLMQRELVTLLAEVSCIELEGRILPKYLYPSIGNTYAVRCYVNIEQVIYGSDDDHIAAGYYYYNPLKKALSHVNYWLERINYNTSSIELVVYWPAIKPIYPEDTRRLVYLEAGHMLNLLSNKVQELGLVIKIEICEQDLDENNTLLARLLINTNSVANTDEIANTVITPYVRNSGLSYSSKRKNIDLNKQSIFERAYKFIGPVLENGKVLLTVNGVCSATNLIYAGMCFQELTDSIYVYNYASCMLAYKADSDTLYAMVLGKVTTDQQYNVEDNITNVPLKDHIDKYLSNLLPKYMIPYDYIVLDKLPLTANGKIAVDQLPTLQITATDSYVAPRNNNEQQLCEIFREVLGLEPNKVGIKDDFFRLGGNSILAMQLVRLISSKLNIQIKLIELYRYQTVELLCATLENSKRSEIRVKGIL